MCRKSMCLNEILFSGSLNFFAKQKAKISLRLALRATDLSFFQEFSVSSKPYIYRCVSVLMSPKGRNIQRAMLVYVRIREFVEKNAGSWADKPWAKDLGKPSRYFRKRDIRWW